MNDTDPAAGDIDAYIQDALAINALREPILHQAIQSLHIPVGSHGLDVGCGIGLQAMILAESVGSDGYVTGLDMSPEFLRVAEKIVEQSGLSDRVSFEVGDANHLPFADNVFDWSWSVDCVGYAPIAPIPLLQELERVVKPGGQVAILAWTSESLLPGYPVLEGRLRATAAGIAPFKQGQEPKTHFLRALSWLRHIDLKEASVKTFVGEAHAPLPDNMYRALKALIQMRWDGMESEMTDIDWSEYQRLCKEESPDFILHSPDYFAFFTYSMFYGRVSE